MVKGLMSALKVMFYSQMMKTVLLLGLWHLKRVYLYNTAINTWLKHSVKIANKNQSGYTAIPCPCKYAIWACPR